MTERPYKKKAKKKIIIESLLVFFIALAPFLYKLYDYLPTDPEATLSIFGAVIDRNGFPDISTYAWFMMSKFIPLYLLIFWFLTSKNWWYHIILIPIAMYSFQVFEVVFDSDNYIDTENIWWIIPICMLIIPFVYFLRITLYDKHVNGIDLKAMEEELQTLKDKQKADDIIKAQKSKEVEEIPQYESILDMVDRKLSTANIESFFKQFQNQLSNWLQFRS